MEIHPSSSDESPYLGSFETFRIELDEHHDRRERIVKTSRDITAASKKIIFALQRVRAVGQPIPSNVRKNVQQHYQVVEALFKATSSDLQDGNAFRYARNISGGLQEFIEAIAFQHYLEHQRLLTYKEATAQVQRLCAEGTIYQLGVEDYLLGLLDTSGELMRFAITTMALSGQRTSSVDDGQIAISQASRSVLDDMRKLHLFLTNFDCESDFHFKKDFQGKLAVMDASVDKVEKALYGLIVRGSERPKGWIPDLQDHDHTNRVEV